MIDDQIILKIERLRDGLDDLRKEIRARYRQPTRQVVAESVKQRAAQLAEVWMVEVISRQDLQNALDAETVADLNIQFQRLLTYSEKSVVRRKYDSALRAILTEFRARIVVPLKARRNQAGLPLGTTRPAPDATRSLSELKSMFVGHSFDARDKPVVDVVCRLLTTLDIKVVTGEKPKADRVSTKVRRRIEECEGFMGVFTERDKLAGKDKWATSAWIIDEKAYALASNKKLVLIKERRVSSIGGLQGDYEYLEFDRDDLADLILRLLEMIRHPG